MTPIPTKFTFQWHINETCNRRCTHCYQSTYGDPGFDLTGLLHVLEKLITFLKGFEQNGNTPKAHINFTGGEPFLHPDFLSLLKVVKTSRRFSFGILSNGYLLPPKELNALFELQPKFVQISLEGCRETNDSIRGTGSYDEVCRALKTYQKAGIPTLLSFTANVKNYNEIKHVSKTARNYGVFKVWTDRYLPCNNSDPLALNKEQTQDYFCRIRKEQNRQKYRPLSKTRIASDRALQFLMSGGLPYKCTAGTRLFTIMHNGIVYPCRRLPIELGNILNDDLRDIYDRHPVIKDLHNPSLLDSDCRACAYSTACAGGLRCLSYAKFGNFQIKDPGCGIHVTDGSS